MFYIARNGVYLTIIQYRTRAARDAACVPGDYPFTAADARVHRRSKRVVWIKATPPAGADEIDD